MKRDWNLDCLACGAVFERPWKGPIRYCASCRPVVQKLRELAMRQVAEARRDARLPAVSTLECKDCGKPARDYDHRDYTRPLDVEPVCRGCNIRRGPATGLLNNVQHFYVDA